jgi:hypothetical protein
MDEIIKYFCVTHRAELCIIVGGDSHITYVSLFILYENKLLCSFSNEEEAGFTLLSKC